MVLTSEVDALLDVPLARWPPPVSLERNKTLSGLFSGSIESNDDELVFWLCRTIILDRAPLLVCVEYNEAVVKHLQPAGAGASDKRKQSGTGMSKNNLKTDDEKWEPEIMTLAVNR